MYPSVLNCQNLHIWIPLGSSSSGESRKMSSPHLMSTLIISQCSTAVFMEQYYLIHSGRNLILDRRAIRIDTKSSHAKDLAMILLKSIVRVVNIICILDSSGGNSCGLSCLMCNKDRSTTLSNIRYPQIIDNWRLFMNGICGRQGESGHVLGGVIATN